MQKKGASRPGWPLERAAWRAKAVPQGAVSLHFFFVSETNTCQYGRLQSPSDSVSLLKASLRKRKTTEAHSIERKHYASTGHRHLQG
jgi:hypothetical protein